MENKGLEAFENIRTQIRYPKGKRPERSNEELLNDLNIGEKELKALEIIVKKSVHTYWIRQATNLSEYNYFVADLYSNDCFEDLTEDEFNFLKGVLK